jgi:ABC-2 type transport system permease protein
MRKILIVANREYQASVRTKTFLVGLLIMPIIMGASLILQYLLRDVVDIQDKRFALVDRFGDEKIVEFLKAAAEGYNQTVKDPDTGEQKRPRYVVEVIAKDDKEAEQRLELSKQVRAGDYLGFMEILPTNPDSPKPHAEVTLRYQTNRPTFADFAMFAEKSLSQFLRDRLANEKKLKPETTARLVHPVFLDQKGLATQDAEGNIEEASDQSRFGSLIIPSVLTVLMFMLILMGSTPLMQGVVEEKMQRIAEVLLGSLRPFELMMGKLIGMTGVSLTIGAVYLGGAYWAANQFGMGDALTADLILWFILFQTLASLMFGSLFIAVGAACTEMKETQNLVLPVMLLACIPMFLMSSILREPNGPVIRGLTFFPFATPTLMVARLAILPNIPWWEPVLAVLIVLATTLLCVWIAGRIFRVGILLQGKGANFRQILRWVVKG